MRAHDRLLLQVLIRLSQAGVMCWPHPSGTFVIPGTRKRIVVGRKGQADLLAVLPPSGHLVGIEIKTGSGRQTKEQRDWQAALQAVGGTYLVVRHISDLDDILGNV